MNFQDMIIIGGEKSRKNQKSRKLAKVEKKNNLEKFLMFKIMVGQPPSDYCTRGRVDFLGKSPTPKLFPSWRRTTL